MNPLGRNRAPGTCSARLRVDVEGVVEPACPLVAARRGQQVEPRGNVEAALENGDPDRLAPQHAGVARERVAVGQLGDEPGGLGEVVAVVEVSERDRGGPHQSAPLPAECVRAEV